MFTGLLKTARGGSLNPCYLLGDKSIQVASAVRNTESIPGRRTGQHQMRIYLRARQDAPQVRHVGVEALARTAGAGDSSHAASTSESVLTARFRLISSTAISARCLGVPNEIGVPAAVISNGPKKAESEATAVHRASSPPGSRRRQPIIVTSPDHFLGAQYQRISVRCSSSFPPGRRDVWRGTGRPGDRSRVDSRA